MVRGKRFLKTKIFVVIASLLLSSLFLPLAPNASAFELTTEVQETGSSWYPANVRCHYLNGTITDMINDPACLVTNEKPLAAIQVISPTINIKKDHYYRFTLAYQWYGTQIARGLVWTPKVSDDWVLVSFNQTVFQDGGADGNGTNAPYNNMFDITLKAKRDVNNGTIAMGITGTNQSLAVVFPANNTGRTYVVMGQIFEYIKSDTTSYLDEQKVENEQDGQQSQTDSEGSVQQVEGATQNIISVIGDFFGAFLSATSTNCVFNWGMAEYGFGNIDFCSIEIPAVFSVILNIVSILVIVPMVLWLFSSIIKAFKEFQE